MTKFAVLNFLQEDFQDNAQQAFSSGQEEAHALAAADLAQQELRMTEKLLEKDESCSSSDSKKDLEICLRVKERIISNPAKLKEKEYTDKPSRTFTSSLRSSIDSKSKIKYLD